MAISMLQVREMRADGPPRIIFYGPQGQGKTSLGAEFPNPAFLMTEVGVPKGLRINALGGGQLNSYREVVAVCMALLNEQHNFSTVVLDTLTAFEKLVQQEACIRNNWKDIEQPGYGKGYKLADYIWTEWMEIVNRLRDAGMAVVMLAHSDIERVDDPTTTGYSRFEVNLHKRASPIVESGVDAILLIKQAVTITKEEAGFGKGRAIGSSGELRWIYCNPSAAYVAKNRYNMPDMIPYPKGGGWNAIGGYFMPDAAPVPTIEQARLVATDGPGVQLSDREADQLEAADEAARERDGVDDPLGLAPTS